MSGLLLFLLIIVWPFAELYLLVQIGIAIGVWKTLGLLLLSAFIGSALVKREGFRIVRETRSAIARGEAPTQTVIEGLLAFTGAMLFIVPGVLSDALGIFLLIPFTRRTLAAWLLSWLRVQIKTRKIVVTGWDNLNRSPQPDVIDVEAVEVSPPRISDHSDLKQRQ